VSRRDCEKLKVKFQDWCNRKNLPEAARVLDEDWDRMVTFYSFPKPHWQHLRTSNVVESPFAALRLRTDAAKRFKRVDSATAAIFKLLLVAEKNFRRLNAPELLREGLPWYSFQGWRKGNRVVGGCCRLNFFYTPLDKSSMNYTLDSPWSLSLLISANDASEFGSPSPLVVDLGCGRNKCPGAIGMDNADIDGVDVVHDLLDVPYPFRDSSVSSVHLSHVLEHFEFEDVVKILDEVHRICTSGGEVIISVPHAGSLAAFCDPTHKSFYTYSSLYYLDRNHRSGYYKKIHGLWRVDRIWTSVNLSNDTLHSSSKLTRSLERICSRAMKFLVRRSTTFTLPDLLVKSLPFWLVTVHCRLIKDGSDGTPGPTGAGAGME
jgi:SAM-dependent methyltransferase